MLNLSTYTYRNLSISLLKTGSDGGLYIASGSLELACLNGLFRFPVGSVITVAAELFG